ncbi:bifunctional P-loop containing nucleoside triphosphate hydrolase/ATPase [Babesia duncani]|uniref:Bifunctional P-loop containing nucleoside triphosphate hydrolase/ATPase n=1 Tax=Babesia duncani TaxID=323732 RepID=A0AAD9UQM4_9APIC|nr:bifunctional P-loop containing nucleoside triphosphate hydrolase/ATPase [Babesia duncani]
MGYLIGLNVQSGNSNFDLYNVLRKGGVTYLKIDLKYLRKALNSYIGNPGLFVYNTILDYLRKYQDCQKSIVILDKFDLWSVPNDFREFNNTNPSSVCNDPYILELIDKIKFIPGTDNKYNKGEVCWTYKLLYLIRYSIIYRIKEEYDHDLTIFGVYGKYECTSGFYGDVFHDNVDLVGFLKSDIFKSFGIDANVLSKTYSSRRHDYLNHLSRELDLCLKGSTITSVTKPYDFNALKGSHFDTSLADIPFNVSYESIGWNKITLICGNERSGKTSLLHGLVKCWRDYHLKQICIACNNNQTVIYPQVLKLDYCCIFSQFVGSGETYIRNIFLQAKGCTPALIYIDDFEILLKGSNVTDDTDASQYSMTLLKTLINELSNLKNGIYFIGCMSGHTLPYDLPIEFLNLVSKIIVLPEQLGKE